MKDNMVQELLLRAALMGQNTTLQPTANINQGQKPLPNNMQNGGRAALDTLLKSLYINNAPNQGSSNINNVNNSQAAQIPQMSTVYEQNTSSPQIFEKFLQQEPDFFKGREILFDYLSTSGANCDTEELSKIARLAKTLEEAAIKRFCAKNPKYAQFLQQENQKTLNKLENTANSGFEGMLKGAPVFSEQDISKMSSDEFLKNENAINAQISSLLRNSQ